MNHGELKVNDCVNICVHENVFRFMFGRIKDDIISWSSVARVIHEEEVETVFLEFESELSVGEAIFLIDYTGTLNDQLRGFYRSKYTIDGEERFLAVTLFEVCLSLQLYTCMSKI